MKILHLSDLHFHRNDFANEPKIKTLDFVKSNYPEHYVVISGDIINNGVPKQLDKAYEELKDLKGRIFLCPGNHDVEFLGNFYNLDAGDNFDQKLSIPLEQGGLFYKDNEPVVNVVNDDTDSVMFIALDTSVECETSFDAACGEVGDVQLNALSNILSSTEHSDAIKVLFFHHHPFDRLVGHLLKDASELIDVIDGKVDVVLFGHNHERDKWENLWGAKYVLASDNSPGRDKAGEITIKNGDISMQYVNIA